VYNGSVKKKSRLSAAYLKKRQLLGLGILLLSLVLTGALYYIYQSQSTKDVAVAASAKNETAPTPEVSTVVSTEQADAQITFGYSVAGKPITGYVFGSGSDTTLMFGSIHGNEMGTADLLKTLVEYIKNNPSAVAEGQRVVIIPILNPDGYYDRTDKLNADEVNLNLNFGTSDWAMYGSEGQYAGPYAWSEPESRVLRSVVEKYLPNRMISYHSNGSLSNPELTSASQELAWWYAEESGYTYYADPAWDYSGTATKWFEETYSKPAITIELNDHYMNDWNLNKKPMLEILSGASSSF